MGSHWTDESAILRDLSFAQGRWVPGDIDSAAAGGRPPAQIVKEETEEEYFQRWTAEGDYTTGPDLFRIKKMLELMQEEEASNGNIPAGPIEITKFNTKPMDTIKLIPKSKSITPQVSDNVKEVKKSVIPKKPRQVRNVAIASIMALAAQVSQFDKPLKLSRPEDFMLTHEDDQRRKDSVIKVTDWLQSQDMTFMFKRKSSVNSSKDELKSNPIINGNIVMFKKKSPVQSEGSGSVKSPQTSGKYTPSSWAEEYYKKAVDRSHMRDLVREDVWGRAEKIMKEIDAKKAETLRKQQEAETAARASAETTEYEQTHETSTEEDFNNDNLQGIAYVLLNKSRHELFPGECVVCQVMCAPNSVAPELSPR